jgi:hemerythrin-like domain-containing protein
MASTCPLPEDGASDQKASASESASAAAAETLADKFNAEPALPKLSAQDFRTYNRLAVMMDAYHNHFRYTWNLLYKTCETGSRPAGMSLRAFISQGLHLCHALTIHHTIEEQHVFPELAERMPAFAPKDHLISQHEAIHEGLEKLGDYLDSCRSGEKELRLPELKTIMDTFGEVLWAHLDDEVRMLGAENMRKYWSKQEIMSMNW